VSIIAGDCSSSLTIERLFYILQISILIMSNSYKTKLINFYQSKGRLPSFSEMQKLFNVSSKNTVSYWVGKFIEEGLVAKDKSGKLVPKSIDGKIKVLGYVEAGFPSAAEEELLDVISLDQYLIANRQSTFLLEVSNDSMIEAGIHPGDLVLVERGKNPRIGNVVVAEVDGDWTLKLYDKSNGKVVLLPANRKYSPIYPESSLSIGGVVVGVIRKYQ